MIEGAARDPAVPPALPAPATAGGGGETGFATILMRALTRDAVPDPAASGQLSEPPLSPDRPPPSPPLDPRPVDATDHAVRFDARGVLDMAAVDAAACRPVAASGSAIGEGPDRPVVGAVLRAGEFALPARTQVLPATGPADPVPARVPPKVVTAPDAGPGAPSIAGDAVACRSATTDDSAIPAPRPRARPAGTTLARSAPQVAVAALADGLAVVAAVGALSDAERHRLRDAIAATLSRHGHAPRAVTLLAMPAPPRFVEP